MERQHYWEQVYSTKADDEVSWTQPEPQPSLSLIAQVTPAGRVIDVGGGSSPLAGRLLDAGYAVAVLDISQVALDRARLKLGRRGDAVTWIAGDLTKIDSVGVFDVWHDRAVFHFLTEQADRKRYADLLRRTVPVGGHAVVATFAMDGPEKCSGLEVVRYEGPSLRRELGPGLCLLKTVAETHLTPWGGRQSFQYSVFKRTEQALP